MLQGSVPILQARISLLSFITFLKFDLDHWLNDKRRKRATKGSTALTAREVISYMGVANGKCYYKRGNYWEGSGNLASRIKQHGLAAGSLL
ncbi:hypothetical protein NFI96_023561 [Prochilodus magdalenae]|nr:hypothetical protein NFI96_023561 [Prochilodus magdalenae]